MNRLKRATSILLLLMYLFQSTELHQFMKLPDFVKHYQEHRAEDPAMSLFTFIDIHYGHGNVLDDDYQEDMKLPFKTCHSDFSSWQVVSNHPEYAFHYIMLAQPTSGMPMYQENVELQSYLDAIWQPPRIA